MSHEKDRGKREKRKKKQKKTNAAELARREKDQKIGQRFPRRGRP